MRDERYAMTPCEPADSDKEDVKYGLWIVLIVAVS